jgi:hypothetical protein
MTAKDLITSSRATEVIAASSPTAALVADLITSASDAIEKYCRRYFVSRGYDEVYNGTGDRRLLLRQYPIQAVTAVRYQPATVLSVINTNTSLNQQARVQVTSTGLQLWRKASGVAITEALLAWSSYPTLAQLAAAIAARGNGWYAQVAGSSDDYGKWPSADLWIPPSFGDGVTSQGYLTARGQYAALLMHTCEMAGYQWDAGRGWLLRAMPHTDPELVHSEDLVWPVGINNIRVQYTAGYTTIPEAVQQACAEWVADLYWHSQRDPSLVQSMGISGAAAGYKTVISSQLGRPPDRVRALLEPYRRCTISTNQG